MDEMNNVTMENETSMEVAPVESVVPAEAENPAYNNDCESSAGISFGTILNSAFSIALWGEDRSRGGSNNYYGNNRGQRNSYDGYYQGSQNNRPNPPPVRRSLQNLDFESRGDAEDTLAGLRDALYRYRQVSVGDLWDLMGVTNDSTDYNYGWCNLDDAFIKGIPGGFRLILPHTVPLR